MKIKFTTSALQSALALAGVVPPKSAIPTQPAAYLFMPTGSGTGVQIHSRDGLQEARAEVPCEAEDFDAPFLFAATYADALSFSGEYVTFETKEEQGTTLLGYVGERGNRSDRPLLDAALVLPITTPLDDDAQVFNVSTLLDALNQAKAFLPKLNDPTVEEPYKTVMLVDSASTGKKIGTGHLYVSDSYRAFYCHTPDFEGKAFNLHGTYLPTVTSFLAKLGDSTVKVLSTPRKLWLMGSTAVLAVPGATKVHERVTLYTKDTVTLQVPRELLVAALKYLRGDMESKLVKVKVLYEPDPGTLAFVAVNGSTKSQSFPVPAKIKEGTEASTDSKTFQVNIDHLLSLVASCRGQVVEVRFNYQSRDGQDMVLLRTVDEYHLSEEGKVVATGGALCKATRYVGSMG